MATQSSPDIFFCQAHTSLSAAEIKDSSENLGPASAGVARKGGRARGPLLSREHAQPAQRWLLRHVLSRDNAQQAQSGPKGAGGAAQGAGIHTLRVLMSLGKWMGGLDKSQALKSSLARPPERTLLSVWLYHIFSLLTPFQRTGNLDTETLWASCYN